MNCHISSRIYSLSETCRKKTPKPPHSPLWHAPGVARRRLRHRRERRRRRRVATRALPVEGIGVADALASHAPLEEREEEGHVGGVVVGEGLDVIEEDVHLRGQVLEEQHVVILVFHVSNLQGEKHHSYRDH